jgi:prepilin-type N-terminal cleavage/methylation domain-containing protein
MTCSTGVRPGQRGFTLLEIVVVLVLLAVCSVGIGAMQSNLFRNESSVADVQARTRLVAECGEQVWGVRRRSEDGYAEVTDSTLARFGAQNCGGLPSFSGQATPTVSITPYSGTACPTGTACRQLQISQGSLTPLTLLVIDY